MLVPKNIDNLSPGLTSLERPEIISSNFPRHNSRDSLRRVHICLSRPRKRSSRTRVILEHWPTFFFVCFASCIIREKITGNVLKHDTDTRARNHFCRGKAIRITYSECGFVALVTQHAHKWQDFRGGKVT